VHIESAAAPWFTSIPSMMPTTVFVAGSIRCTLSPAEFVWMMRTFCCATRGAVHSEASAIPVSATPVNPRRRTRVLIVIVVNEQAEALKEELAVGLRQARNLEVLRDIASRTGCPLGCYFSLCDGEHDTFRATYIHSKLMIVDDRFLTVGSANLTNRSMGLDSELHLTWEQEGGDGGLLDSIRNVRVSLLAEHAGLFFIDRLVLALLTRHRILGFAAEVEIAGACGQAEHENGRDCKHPSRPQAPLARSGTFRGNFHIDGPSNLFLRTPRHCLQMPRV